MRAIRFTRAEKELLVELLGPALVAESPKARKVAAVIAAKLVAAEVLKPITGTSIREAVDAFRRALGTRLIVPPSSAGAVYARMQQRLTELGIGPADCFEVARLAGVVWAGPIRAESLVRQADKLLGGPLPDVHANGSPVELGEDEI